jgi:hypothetical protein
MRQDLEHLAAAQFHGRGVESLFPEGSGPVRSAPWPRAARSRAIHDYDQPRVAAALSRPPQLQEVDPRDLHSTQPSIHRPGVDYYSGSHYHETGLTYEPTENVGNRFPVVYHRGESPPESGLSVPPQRLLLSGHHRAAAALVKGEPLRAIVVEGPWGGKR